MHKTITGLLAALISGSVYITSSAAFAQSTPLLGLPIKERIDTSISERIPEEIDTSISEHNQQEIDGRSETTNYHEKEVKQKDNSATPPPLTKPILEENPDNSVGPNSKYRYP